MKRTTLCNNVDQSDWTEPERQRARQNIGLKVRTTQNVYVAQAVTQGPILELNYEFENGAEYHLAIAFSNRIELQNYNKNKARMVYFIGERSNPAWRQIFNVKVDSGFVELNQTVFPFNWLGENITSPYNTFNVVFEDADDESTLGIATGQDIYINIRGTISKEAY